MREAAFLPGEIVVVPFPFTDASAAKVRPALVLSDAEYNAASPDVVVCGLTSRLANSAHSVLVTTEDLESGALPRPSRVKTSKVTSLAKSVIRARVGRLKKEPFARVLREFEALYTNG